MPAGECESVRSVVDGLAAFTRAAGLEELRAERFSGVRIALLDYGDVAPRRSKACFAEEVFPPAVTRALLEHRFQAARWYAGTGNIERWRAIVAPEEHLSNWAVACSDTPIGLSLAKLDCPTYRIGEAPAYLIGTETTQSPTVSQVALAADACGHAISIGFRPLLEAVGVLVFVRHRDLLGQSNSWTTTGLPGTIYTDFTDYPDALAVEIVHEAAHLWLNDAFRAVGFPKRTRQRFKSPWKDAPREAFGFIHAVFAFSCVAILAREIIRQNPDAPGRTFLQSIYEREAQRLTMVTPDVSRVLELVDPNVALLIEAAHREASYTRQHA